MARFVSALLTALLTGGTAWTTSQIGFPFVVTSASTLSVIPSRAVLLAWNGPRCPATGSAGADGVTGSGTKPH